MIYGFDIMSLYNLIEKNVEKTAYHNDNTEVLNPYTRNPFSAKVKKDFQPTSKVNSMICLKNN